MAKDLLGECNEHGMDPEQFRQWFCQACHNHECHRAGFVGTKWEHRMLTQEDRLLINPNFADLSDPRFFAIAKQDFVDRRREALKVHIADELGDWSIPTVDDEQLAAKGSATASAVQQAVALLGTEKKSAPGRGAEPVSDQSTVSDQFTPPSEEPQRPVVAQGLINTPALPEGGIMVGGGPAPAPAAQPARVVVDPWAVPQKPKNLVPVGATITLGGKRPDGE